MRKDVLHNTLLQPEMLSEDQLRELRETVDRYPFFGAAQVALSKAYRDHGDHRFSDQLSSAAIYTSNRAALYQRFRKERKIEAESTSPIVVKIGESTGSLAAAIVDQEETSTLRIPIDSPIADSEIASTPIQTIEEVEPIIQVIAAQPETEALRIEMLETLEAQILVDAVSKSIELEVQPEADDTREPPRTQAESLIPDDENSYAALIYRRAQQRNNGLISQPEAEVSACMDDDIEEDLPAFQSTPLSHGIRRIQTTGAKDHQRELIDRFIRTEPQIARGKAGEYQPGNLAKDSLEEDFSFVTETMAVLFAKQGKLDKARKAFRKLMEQHPEKSIYFAAQLKNLEHFKK